tara:strand:+ start:361 stop:693 length:333 start_codon:yes stop_codon:yes gene_type:complete
MQQKTKSSRKRSVNGTRKRRGGGLRVGSIVKITRDKDDRVRTGHLELGKIIVKSRDGLRYGIRLKQLGFVVVEKKNVRSATAAEKRAHIRDWGRFDTTGNIEPWERRMLN